MGLFETVERMSEERTKREVKLTEDGQISYESTNVVSDMWKCMVGKERTDEEKSRGFWYAAGTVQLGAFFFASGPSLPIAAATGLMAWGGFDAIQRLAYSKEDTPMRSTARNFIAVCFGVEGSETIQIRRRLVDVGGSIGVAFLLGGTSIVALLGGLAAGAALTLVTTSQPAAKKEWFDTKREATKDPKPSLFSLS